MNQQEDKDDVWVHQQEGHIHYFVHRPTRHCGIHIRGLAELCGVADRAIRSAIETAERAKKAEGDLRKIRETDLSNILKDREIFLVDLRKISHKLNGKEAKVILADVCFDIAHYYSGQGYQAAFKTVGDMGRLGAESFIGNRSRSE